MTALLGRFCFRRDSLLLLRQQRPFYECRPPRQYCLGGAVRVMLKRIIDLSEYALRLDERGWFGSTYRTVLGSSFSRRASGKVLSHLRQQPEYCLITDGSLEGEYPLG